MATASMSARFTSHDQVIEALRRLPAYYDPRTASVIRLPRGGSGDLHSAGFRPGFIATFEERAELLRRLRRLDERARTLLVLWFVEDRSAPDIARRLNVSRVHCYRLRERALRAMLDGDTDAPQVAMAETLQSR